MDLQLDLQIMLLIILGISSNFVAETLGCKMQQLFSQNMLAKQCLVLTSIFSSVALTTSAISPLYALGISIKMWVCFIVFAKIHLPTQISILMLLGASQILKLHVNYIESKSTIDTYQIAMYTKIMHGIVFAMVVLLVVGFIKYTRFQLHAHKGNFSVVSYLFGVIECDSSKSMQIESHKL